MSKFDGKWELQDSDNFEEYMVAIGNISFFLSFYSFYLSFLLSFVLSFFPFFTLSFFEIGQNVYYAVRLNKKR